MLLKLSMEDLARTLGEIWEPICKVVSGSWLLVAAQVDATTTWAGCGERNNKTQSTHSSLVEVNPSKSDRFCLGDYPEGFPQCHQPLLRRSSPVCPFSHLQSYHVTLTTSRKLYRLYSVQCLVFRRAIQSELLRPCELHIPVYGCSVTVSYGAYQFPLHCCIAIYTTTPDIQKGRSLTNSQAPMSTAPTTTISLCALLLVARMAVLLVR